MAIINGSNPFNRDISIRTGISDAGLSKKMPLNYLKYTVFVVSTLFRGFNVKVLQ